MAGIPDRLAPTGGRLAARAAGLLVLWMVGFAASAQIAPLSPDTMVAGVSQEAWSRRWWQWAAGFEPADSPVRDATGAKCGAGQRGPVWFLAGAFGSHRVERVFHVPADRYLFFPLVNYVVVRNPRGRADCASLAANARSITDDPAALLFEAAGHRYDRLAGHCQASADCFTLGGLRAAADGYYVMLAPLPRDTHVVDFGGLLPTLGQAITYTLIVE